MIGNIGRVMNQSIKAAAIIATMVVITSAAHAEKINLNIADVKTIQYIPGVGKSKAKKIVQFRKENGAFESMDQIDAIEGFGKRTMIGVKKYGSIHSGVSELTPEMKSNRPTRTLSKISEAVKKSAS